MTKNRTITSVTSCIGAFIKSDSLTKSMDLEDVSSPEDRYMKLSVGPQHPGSGHFRKPEESEYEHFALPSGSEKERND